MTGKEQISAPQIAMLMIPVIVATSILSVPGTVAQFAKEDAYISIFLTSVTGAWALGVMLALHNRYPGLTPIEYSEKILGKWIGKLVGWYYVYLLFFYPVTVSDEIMSFITLYALPRTPRVASLLLFFAVCAAVVWAGIEAIARCAQAIIPLNILFVLIVSLLLFGDMQGRYLKPVLGHGLLPVFQGAIVPSAWLGEFFFIGFLLPYVKKPTAARKGGFTALGLVIVLLSLVTIITLMVHGAAAEKFNYSYYEAVRYISIGGFLERLDPIILSAWVFGGFVKNSIVLWVFCVSVAQLLKYESYRPLVIPLTLLTLVGCFWMFPNAFEMQKFLKFSFPLWGLVNQNVIPTFLLFIAVIRQRQARTV